MVTATGHETRKVRSLEEGEGAGAGGAETVSPAFFAFFLNLYKDDGELERGEETGEEGTEGARSREKARFFLGNCRLFLARENPTADEEENVS